ncbi:MAG: alpha/beta hydrolase [Alphaproteobacteria bacterium]|nr:alpha/beta hydrolase [Alphaproteobacteria bacterium]
MSFKDMPKMPPLLLPGAPEYAERILALSKKVASKHRTVMDVAYGSDYWQKVDFYLPDDKRAQGVPVLVFIHGGAFRNGFKEWMGFQAPVIIDLPAIFVSISYRLAPDTKFPAIMEDCFDALKLVYDSVGKYGGDHDRIFIGGHSAGGHLSAIVALRPDRSIARGMPADVIKGCFPVSGIYDLRLEAVKPGTVIERVHTQVFFDPLKAPDVSPICHVAGNNIPFFVSWGGKDLPESIEQSETLVAALKRGRSKVASYVFPGMGHFDANMDLDRRDSPWVQTVRDWMLAIGDKRKAPAKKKPAARKSSAARRRAKKTPARKRR